MPSRRSVAFVSFLSSCVVIAGLIAMRTVPADPPVPDPASATPAIRFARVDVPTLLRRSMFSDASLERQRESLARFAPKIEACDAEFRRIIDEADADPEERARETYSRPYLDRLRAIHRRVQELREEFRAELESIVAEHESEAKRITGRVIAEIAVRDGYTAVFTMPFETGEHRWEPDDEEPFAPLAWCGTCPDLTLEVADAIGLPDAAFDQESEYWRIRAEVLREIHGYVAPRPWEPED